MAKEKVLILGASRGLGAALAREILSQDQNAPATEVFGVARKEQHLETLQKELGSRFQFQRLDLSKVESQDTFDSLLNEIAAKKIIYVAGGGPFGSFEHRPFESHQWAWRVTFEGAARTCHWALRQSLPPQVILVGSTICENQGDRHAASYAAAKHALKGLYESLRLEAPDWDLRMVSPGYLDTELLPKNAPVRYKEVWDPQKVAQEIVEWMKQKSNHGDHKVYPPYPEN